MVVCEVSAAQSNQAPPTQNYFSRDAPRPDPPPYPGHMMDLYHPGYRQSYSGSETSTDMSMSSMESLSTSTRQDPQGEETIGLVSSPGPMQPNDSVFMLPPESDPRVAVPGVEVRTDPGIFYINGNHDDIGNRYASQAPSLMSSYCPISPSNLNYIDCNDIKGFASSKLGTVSHCDAAKLNIYNGLSGFGKTFAPVSIPSVSSTDASSVPTPASTTPAPNIPNIKSLQNFLPKSAFGTTPMKSLKKKRELTLPTQCDLSLSYPPPPDYPKNQNEKYSKQDVVRSLDIFQNFKSPDLTHLNAILMNDALNNAVNGAGEIHTGHQSEQNKRSSPPPKKLELDHATVAARATQMVEKLSKENQNLRQQVEGYLSKVSKLQKFEAEIEKVHSAYESLVKQQRKRENLERAMRFKLDSEIKKLTETNKQLTDQLDNALTKVKENKATHTGNDSKPDDELVRKDSLISQLLSQNREALSTKERLDIEVAAQRSTLQEQRTHIAVLDNALTNAHTNILRLEEQLREKQQQEAKVEELENAVAQLQRTSEKREAIEERLRQRLEEQVKGLRAEKSGIMMNRSCDMDEGISSDSESPSMVYNLSQQLREKEQGILQLESDVLKWEQRYLEESALRQLAVDAASMPKDARIAALEQGSFETELIIAESRTERLNHLEEVYRANRRAAELESKNKTLQAQLAEKDAMINVLQRHSSLSRCSSISSVLGGGSPIHSSRPSMMTSSPPNSRPNLCSTPSPPPAHSHSSPGSGNSSRNNSGIANTVYPRDSEMLAHTKSGSTGSAVPVSSLSQVSPSKEVQVKILQQKLAAQAALFRNLQDGTEQLTRCLWQV